MLNSFGLPPHPTDAMIHWSCNNPQEKARVLRAHYDLIATLGSAYADSLNALIDAARDNEISLQAERDAGIDL